MNLTGGCHCGNLRYDLEWPEAAGPQATRHCTCAFCTKHNIRYLSHPEAALAVRIKDSDQINRYRFATATAQFLICRECGVMPLVIGHQDGALQAVVNANTLEDFEMPEAAPISYDGEILNDRLARRKKNWIARVTVEEV